jgi:hypothetical protein
MIMRASSERLSDHMSLILLKVNKQGSASLVHFEFQTAG